MADLADAAGRAVAVPLAALARVRGAKPMHPRGVVFDARLIRTGPARPWGLPWIDAREDADVLVRLSRGAGLPPRLPDLLGLAVRVPPPAPGGRPVDLLLSSTGRGRWTRSAPVLRRDAGAPYGSVMAFRTPLGPVTLAARADGPLPADSEGLLAAGPGRTFTLAAALERGAPEAFARLVLRAPHDPPDPQLHFDAVLHAPPGFVADGAMARFRRPAYARARTWQRVDPAAGPLEAPDTAPGLR
ncbi:phosphodiesterase [Modestobacter marinus]|uniref:phosphodiesterase n=1 Tax=Modestobacter marinus TaxID=477641 RepID=UPI001C94E0C6|nr:phosphodiesterase [Modestobacter marinus]